MILKTLLISLTLYSCSLSQDQWEYQKQYKQGDQVKDEAGNLYQCKKWPFSGWCSVYDPKGNWASQAWQKINKNESKSESNDQQYQKIQLKGNKKGSNKLSQNEINNGTLTKGTIAN